MSALEITMKADEAKRITTKIRFRLNRMADDRDEVLDMIDQAIAGRAWSALGYASWPAYVDAEFAGALSRLSKAERVPFVAALAERGMSTRAIASVVGASPSTVKNDINELANVGQLPDNVVGIDGKNRPRKATLNKAGQVDAKSTADFLTVVPPHAARRQRIKDNVWERSTDSVVGSIEVLETTLTEAPFQAQFIAHRAAVRERLLEARESLDRALHRLDHLDDGGDSDD